MTQPMGMADFFTMEAGEYLERLDAMVSPPGSPDFQEFYRLARALRGSALMASQHQIADVAGGLEALSRAGRDGTVTWEEAHRQLSIRAVDDLNEAQKGLLLRQVVDRFGDDLGGMTLAIWGLAFKPNTDDMREAPSLITIEGLLERGARVVAHDPEASAQARRRFGDRIELGEDDYEVLDGAGALIIHTEWNPYRRPDFERMKASMAQAIVFDGRNLYDPNQMAELGFEYYSVGRAPAPSKTS